MNVALISGTSIVDLPLFSGWDVRRVETKHGAVSYRWRDGQAVFNRHGLGAPLPPHRINHHANLAAVAALGFRDVVAFNSVGSLSAALAPGTLVSCADYVALQQGPATYFDDELKGGAPGIANNLIPRIVAGLAPEWRVETGKVYVQMKGPRFETKAEIRVIKGWGDVVGMTLAHEADLCTELGLNYNSLAIVDNYANGLEGTEIDFVKFGELVKANRAKVAGVFGRLLEILA